MESQVVKLEKLKRRFTLELSLEEIEPVYRSVYRQLRNTRLNGFRPGKFPKGWLDKRFKVVMRQEALERVLPNHINEALKKHELNQATQAVVTDLAFERKTPLNAVIEFEVKPTIELPDYKKIKLTRETPQSVSDDENDQELKNMLKSRANYNPREESAVAEDGNMISLTFGLADKNEIHETQQIRFELGASDYKEFFDAVRGMKVGESKKTDIEHSLKPEEVEAGKKSYEISLTKLETIHLPELGEQFFQELKVKDLDELKTKIRENTEKKRQEEIQQRYRSSIRSQLSGLFDDFDLPEELIHQKEHELEHKIEEQSKKDNSNDPGLNMEDEMKAFRENLRLNYIIDAIGRLEAVTLNRDMATGEFINLASMINQSPEELINTPFGNSMFNQIINRQREESVLDRIVTRTFGDPIEINEDTTGTNSESIVEKTA